MKDAWCAFRQFKKAFSWASMSDDGAPKKRKRAWKLQSCLSRQIKKYHIPYSWWAKLKTCYPAIFSRFCLMKLFLDPDPFFKGKAVWSQRNCTSTPLVPKSDSVQLGPKEVVFWDDEETHVRILSSLCTLFTPHKAFPYETMVVMTRPMKQRVQFTALLIE